MLGQGRYKSKDCDGDGGGYRDQNDEFRISNTIKDIIRMDYQQSHLEVNIAFWYSGGARWQPG